MYCDSVKGDSYSVVLKKERKMIVVRLFVSTVLHFELYELWHINFQFKFFFYIVKRVFVSQLVKWIRGDAEDQLNKFSQAGDSLQSANQSKARFDREFYPLAKVWQTFIIGITLCYSFQITVLCFDYCIYRFNSFVV